jgi:hypothetical protein
VSVLAASLLFLIVFRDKLEGVWNARAATPGELVATANASSKVNWDQCSMRNPASDLASKLDQGKPVTKGDLREVASQIDFCTQAQEQDRQIERLLAKQRLTAEKQLEALSKSHKQL